MLIRRKRVSGKKLEIWDKIHFLQNNIDKDSSNAITAVEDIYLTFNSLSDLDPKVKNAKPDIAHFYILSIKLLQYICDNFNRDPNFDCLNIVTDLLTMYLWKQGYHGGKTINKSIVNGVENFFNEEQMTLNKYLDQIIILHNLERELLKADKNNDKRNIDSLKYRYDNTKKVIISYCNELNSKQEAFLAGYQKGIISSEKTIANFKFSDEVAKENNDEYNKINEAANKHYEYVRSKSVQFIIDLETDAVANSDDIDISKIAKTIRTANDDEVSNTITNSINNTNNPDFIGAYANMRFKIDTYLKYKMGIDLNMYANKTIPYTIGGETQIRFGNIFKNSQDIFKDVFGKDYSSTITKIWKDSSSCIHGGEKWLNILTNPQEMENEKNKINEYNSLLNNIINLKDIDYIEGVKKLYLNRKSAMDQFFKTNSENGFCRLPEDKILKQYQNYLIANGVDEEFFTDTVSE